MKKLFIVLICSLVAAWSCHIDGSYSATNVQDFVTITEGKLVNDLGVVYTVSDKASEVPELLEGQRYYLLFDILNKYYDISIIQGIHVDVLETAKATEADAQLTAHDPVVVQLNWIGGNYIDLGFKYYYDPASDCAHNVFCHYALEDGNKTKHFYLYHDGNNENPAAMDMDKLKEKLRIISIPLGNLDGIDQVCLSLDLLGVDAEGKYQVVSQTYSTSSN